MSQANRDAEAVVDVFVFRLAQGVTRETFAEAARSSQRWLGWQPGFVGRELLEDAQRGTYIDIVRWASREQAQGAADAFMTAPECADFLRAIDPGTVQMTHARDVGAF